ncbi:MAG: oligosaccharide flippase family protein [Thermoplasmatales archaeon]|jgi:O-antigen/teichoic acid export membrane protein
MELEIKEEISGGIFFQYVNSIALVLAGFIFYIYIIHFYSSELVGTVALLLAIASLMNIFFSLGLGYGLQHYISYHMGRQEYGKVREIIAKFLLTGLSLGILSLLALYLTSPIFAMLFFHTFKFILLMKYLGIDLLFMVFSTFLSSILIGLQNFKSQALWNIVGIFITYSLPVVLLAAFNNSIFIVLGWAAGYAFSSIAYLLIIMGRVKHMAGNVGGAKIGPIFSYAIPLFLASLIGYGASYVDRFVVSYLLNLSLLGIYNFALLISSAIGFIVGPFATILLPKLSEMYGLNKKDEIRNYVAKGIELLSTVYVPVAMLVAALSSSILLFLSSSTYLPASAPVMIVLVVSSLFVSGNILSVSLQGIRKTRIFLITSSLALLSNFIISILLIPRYQMIGASIGYSSITVVSFFIMYYYARKFEILKFEIAKIAKIYASGFVMFFIIFELQNILRYSPLKLLGYIVLGFAIYSGMIKVMRTFSREDLDFLMLLIPWWLQKVRGIISALFL